MQVSLKRTTEGELSGGCLSPKKSGLGGGFIQRVFAIFTFPSLGLHDSSFERVETTIEGSSCTSMFLRESANAAMASHKF